MLPGGRGIKTTRRDLQSPFPPLPFPRHTRNLPSLFSPLCARARARESGGGDARAHSRLRLCARGARVTACRLPASSSSSSSSSQLCFLSSSSSSPFPFRARACARSGGGALALRTSVGTRRLRTTHRKTGVPGVALLRRPHTDTLVPLPHTPNASTLVSLVSLCVTDGKQRGVGASGDVVEMRASHGPYPSPFSSTRCVLLL